MNRDLRLIS